MPRPRPHCARWGPSPPTQKKWHNLLNFRSMSFEVGLCPGHIVLDGNLAPLPKNGAPPPIFGPCLLWPNGRMDQHVTWYGVGLGPGHIVADGDPALLPRKGGTASQIFGPCLLWPNGWMDQDTTWYGGRPRPRRRCDRWGPSSP